MAEDETTKVPISRDGKDPEGDTKPSGSQEETPLKKTSKSLKSPDSGSDMKTGAKAEKAKAVTDKGEGKTREDQKKGKDSTKPKKAKKQKVKKEKKKKGKRKKKKEPKEPHPKVHIKDVPGVVFPQHLGDVFVIMMILALAIGAGAFWFLAWLPTNELPVQKPGENIQQFSEEELQDILKILDAREEASKAPVIPPTRDPFAE